MDVKDFLKSIRALETRIITERELIARLNALEESCTAQLTDMPMGTDMRDKTDIYVKRIMKEDEIRPYLDILNEKLKKGEEIIKLLPDYEQQTVFIQYYLLNNTWNQVCKEVHCCYTKAQDIHKAGIDYLRKLKIAI